MSKNVKIGFVVNTEDDTYEISVDGTIAAIITIEVNDYINIATTIKDNVLAIKAAALAWEEFERRDEFTDFTIEVNW